MVDNNNNNNQNAGRQARHAGRRGRFPVDVSSRPGPSGQVANWICLLRGVGGRGVALRIGRRSFRLTSDTIYFLEETAAAEAAGCDAGYPARPPRPGQKVLFTYVCGTTEALANTLQELRRTARSAPGLAAESNCLLTATN